MPFYLYHEYHERWSDDDLHFPDWKANTHTRGEEIRWKQFSGRLQFLSSLSGSTTGIQSSSRTSTGVCKIIYITVTVFSFYCRYWAFYTASCICLISYTPSLLWALSNSMISSSTSCCPPGSESSAVSDSWTQSKAAVACTLTLKHTHMHVHLMSPDHGGKH